MEQQVSLFDLNLKETDNSIEFKDEMQKDLDRLRFESEVFVNTCYDENQDLTLSKQKITLIPIRSTKQDKNGKAKLFLMRHSWVEKFEDFDVFVDEIPAKDLNELEQIIQAEKENIEWYQELMKKGLIFDGHRYCWTFEYKDKKLKFLEKD